jgi:hypothetical protein
MAPFETSTDAPAMAACEGNADISQRLLDNALVTHALDVAKWRLT